MSWQTWYGEAAHRRLLLGARADDIVSSPRQQTAPSLICICEERIRQSRIHMTKSLYGQLIQVHHNLRSESGGNDFVVSNMSAVTLIRFFLI